MKKHLAIFTKEVDTFAEVLRMTRGSWGPETKEEKKKEKARRKMELVASMERKKPW